MILLELFAGIGGFSKGFEQAGCSFEQTYFSEIDKHAIANFKFNFPHAIHIGSVENITGADIPQFGISNLTFVSGKMLKECSSQNIARISGPYLKRLPTLGIIDSNGNCLIQNGFYPKVESEYTLSDVVQDNVPETFFLSERNIARMIKLNIIRIHVLER